MSFLSKVKAVIERYKKNILFNRLFTILSIDILVKVSGLVLLPVYLRLMTQEEYGLYGYLLSIILTVSLVLNFGLYIPISKFYLNIKNNEDKGKFLFTITVVLIFLLIVILLPTYIFKLDFLIIESLFKNAINYTAYRIPVLLAIVATVLNFMLSNFFYVSEKIKHIKIYNIWRIILINLVALIALFYFTKSDDVQVRLVATYLVEVLLICVFSVFFIKELKTVIDKTVILPSIKLGFPIMMSAFFGIVINFSDKFFLEKYGGSTNHSSFTDLSYYYLAVACASIIPLIFTSFQNAWLPLFLKEKDLAINVKKTKKLLVRLFFVFLSISFFIMLFLKIVISTNIIHAKYERTLYILPIILIAQIIASIVPVYGNYLVYFGKTYIATITGFIISIFTIGLSMLLIPIYKIYGAAIVALMANLFYLVVYYFIIEFHIKKNLVNGRIRIESKT